MKQFITRVLLVLSLLVLPWGTAAWCDAPPSSPPLQLHQAPQTTPNNPQSEDIRDIKGPVAVPDNSRFLLPVLIVGALLLIALLLLYFRKRRQKPTVCITSSDTIALAELDQARSLMKQPLVYADRVSSILRQYIESRFQIHSTRQTTHEFFSCLKNGSTIIEIDLHDPAGNLRECMEQCDIAKFAHGIPGQAGMIAMDQAVRTFIETTRKKDLS